MAQEFAVGSVVGFAVVAFVAPVEGVVEGEELQGFELEPEQRHPLAAVVVAVVNRHPLLTQGREKELRFHGLMNSVVVAVVAAACAVLVDGTAFETCAADPFLHTQGTELDLKTAD